MMEKKEQILEKSRMRRLKEFLNGTMEEEEVLEILEEVELEDIKRIIRLFEKAKKRKEGGKKYKFKFDATGHRRMKPYVAKLLVEEGKLERKFMDLIFEQNGSSVRVYGEYKAEAGDIIEKRLNGSRNDERYWYVVTEEGEEVEVANIKNKTEKKRVIDYLKGEIKLNELLESVPAARK